MISIEIARLERSLKAAIEVREHGPPGVASQQSKFGKKKPGQERPASAVPDGRREQTHAVGSASDRPFSAPL